MGKLMDVALVGMFMVWQDIGLSFWFAAWNCDTVWRELILRNFQQVFLHSELKLEVELERHLSLAPTGCIIPPSTIDAHVGLVRDRNITGVS